MAVKFLTQQSLKSKPAQLYKSQSLDLVAIVIVINVVIGGFSGKDLKRLAHVTVRLPVCDYSQLSDYNFANFANQLEKNTAVTWFLF